MRPRRERAFSGEGARFSGGLAAGFAFCSGAGRGGAWRRVTCRGMAYVYSEETAEGSDASAAGDTAKKQRGRPFRPGESGNPAGRPRGSRNRVTALCAELLGDEAEEVMRSCIKRARKGDGVALRLCVERLLPVKAARDRAVSIDLPAVAAASDLIEAAGAVIHHAAAGDLTLSEAREYMSLLEQQRKLIETSELAVRVEVLERAAEPEGPGGPDRARVRVRLPADAPAELGASLVERVKRLSEEVER